MRLFVFYDGYICGIFPLFVEIVITTIFIMQFSSSDMIVLKAIKSHYLKI